VAIPKEALISSSPKAAARISSAMRVAAMVASSSLVPGITIANSSPPMRKQSSALRTPIV
jgi:hypothetical protein